MPNLITQRYSDEELEQMRASSGILWRRRTRAAQPTVSGIASSYLKKIPCLRERSCGIC